MTGYEDLVIKDIEDYINIGISLSAEKDHCILLEKILTVARQITRADAGTLFFYENGNLEFKIIQNSSLGISEGMHGKKIALPPVEMNESNVAAFSAIHNKIVNIEDVYNNKFFDFSGPYKYDNITGYTTKSILVIPLEDNNSNIIGVLQLINAKDHNGNIVAFEKYHERLISALGSQAAISLVNMNHLNNITKIFDSFIEVIITAIDAQTSYNVNHAKNIALNVENFVRYLNEKNITKYGYFDEKRIKEIVMTAWVHDIGKIGVPSEIMEKPTRLGGEIEFVMLRLDFIESQLLLKYSEKYHGNINDKYDLKEIKEEIDYIRESKILIKAINESSFVVDESIKEKIYRMGKKQYLDLSNEVKPWLTENQVINLTIERGTLSLKEREIMEKHVEIGEKMLKKISFEDYYSNVPIWASKHHEFLDGTGYPRGIKGDEIPVEARILTILDIFDALVANDRPYKKPMTIEKALITLFEMGKKNKLDIELVKIFAQSKIWEIDSNIGSEYFEKDI